MKKFLGVLLLLFSGAIFAEEPENENVWQPRTRSVAVFKNGLGFFVQEGNVTLENGWCRGKSVPPAAFGTFAVYSLTEKTVVDTIALGPGEILEFDGRQLEKTLDAKRGRLQPCVGLNLQLTYKKESRDVNAAGKLASVTDQYAILETPESSFAVPLEAVEKMQILDMPLRVHVGGEMEEETRLGMAYLRKGIVWVPEYSLKILDDETAELTLRGTIVNEAEDLIDTDVHLVVGVPHFIHSDVLSPFVAGQAIRTLGVNLALSTQNTVPSQMMTQQRAMNAAPENFGAAPRPETVSVEQGGDVTNVLGQLPQTETAGASDYTVYTCQKMTLRRGERAMVTLFTQKIHYSHIYRWTVGSAMGHALLLKNDTSSAWTTGPCLATSDTQALTEDMLKYVPKGGEGELTLTESINIGQGSSLAETDRKIAAHKVTNGKAFDLVTLEGKIRLQNYEPKESQIVVTCPVQGKPITASDEGRLSQDASELRLGSRTGTVSWTLTLKPGEKKELTYTVERYVESW